MARNDISVIAQSNESREEGEVYESIPSSTTPDPTIMRVFFL